MAQRFDIEPDPIDGWNVIDLFAGTPALWRGVPQVGLDIQDASDLAELFDWLASHGHRLDVGFGE